MAESNNTGVNVDRKILKVEAKITKLKKKYVEDQNQYYQQGLSNVSKKGKT